MKLHGIISAACEKPDSALESLSLTRTSLYLDAGVLIFPTWCSSSVATVNASGLVRGEYLKYDLK